MQSILKTQSRPSPLDNERGFTLTEMLIVVSIIALIGTFVTTNVIGQFSKAKVSSTKIQIKNLGTVLDNFRRECNFYPTTDQGLEALVAKPTVGRECKNYDPEGYLKDKKVPLDSWGAMFVYESDGSKYVIKSLGSDNKEGGEGYDADLSSDDTN